MTDADKRRLLFGPYKAPALKRGDRAFCLFRDCAVVVFGWSDGLIPWPLCYRAGTRACGKGLLVDEELVRAIRHESAFAIRYWWGVSRNTARRWRGALDVGRMDPEGSRLLIHTGVQINLLDTRPHEARFWSTEEMVLLGALPDAEVARRIGRTHYAVTKKRQMVGRPAVLGPRRKRRGG